MAGYAAVKDEAGDLTGPSDLGGDYIVGAERTARAHEKQDNYSPQSPSFLGLGGAKNSRNCIFAGMTASKKPRAISSQLCSPNLTSAFGSGLAGLLGELSNHASPITRVPGGSTSGCAKR